MTHTIEQQLKGLASQFGYWEKTKDLIDQLLDIILNYRQSGHPGSSHCKVHILVATMLSGVMRWDICHPEKRFGSSDGVLLPQEITEFANAGILIGMTTVNLSRDPEHSFDGFRGGCSTYGSFSSLKYGLMRLFSQLAQDCELKVSKIIWVAGHSGPETAEDSRTHFGIYAPGVTQLFPDGAIINLHPWEYNEVPVLLGTALRQKAPIVALHLTRPPVEIPDRATLGIPSHFEAARGAYVIRDYESGPRGGMVIVQGASAVANVIKALPELDARRLNVKIVCATSPQMFALQPEAYHRSVLAPSDYADSTVIATQARWLRHDWLFNKVAEAYALGRLGQPLAHRRRGGRGTGRGAPDAGVDREGDRTHRHGMGRAPGVSAGGVGRRPQRVISARLGVHHE